MSKLTPEERAFVGQKLEESKDIAYVLGEQMFQRTNDRGVSVHAACILYASTCVINNIDLHDAMSLFMSIYRQIDKEVNVGPVQ